MGSGGPQAGRRDMGRDIYGHVLWDGTGRDERLSGGLVLGCASGVSKD